MLHMIRLERSLSLLHPINNTGAISKGFGFAPAVAHVRMQPSEDWFEQLLQMLQCFRAMLLATSFLVSINMHANFAIQWVSGLTQGLQLC